jgi:CBS domain-containing protein
METPALDAGAPALCARREDLPDHGRRLAGRAAALLADGVDAPAVAAHLARANDALLRQLLLWAEADLGRPPAAYAWLAMGSEGREEQTLGTDQDNGLVYADEGEAHAKWFQALAERVNADLVIAGFPECPGGHMATRQRATLSAWRRRCAACVDRPDPHDAEILLDLRRAAGSLDVGVLDAELARGTSSSLLVRFLAREALSFSPPAPWLLRLRGGRAAFDVKRHGLVPITFLARCSALAVGSLARRTLDRLAAARAGGALDPDQAAAVGAAHAFLLGLRLRIQLAAASAGRAHSDRVELAALAPPDRRRVLDSFRAVKRWQARAAYHFLAPD